jgi:predicted DCC family thiol-disulfide oxidoreductase YuxK
MTTSTTYPLTLFYDGSCPVCREEVALLMKYDSLGNIALEDCSPAQYAPPLDAPTGVTREAMMTLIHGRDANGQWLVGAPVFAAAYAGCGFAEFAWLWGNPRLQGFWRVVYPWVARNRMFLSKIGTAHALSWVLEKLYARAAKRAVAASATCAVDGGNDCAKTGTR